MNGRATLGDQSWLHRVSLCDAAWEPRERSVNGAMVGFLVAIGVTSTFIFALSRRMERRRAGWGSSRRAIGSPDDGGLSSRNDSWSFASWFGGSETFSSGHNSNSCGDNGASGSWDSGGGVVPTAVAAGMAAAAPTEHPANLGREAVLFDLA
jgi:hypothetical protein